MALKNPILSNPIAVDIQKLNEILDALSRANPTDVDGISTGAMRLYEVSSGKWQWQEYNGSTWAPVPFLQHNVDQLDGYHAAITPAANTVAVRNASGVLEDSITGSAATASSAATLSQTLPVNKGGTGATTSEAARSNLGVPPTSHASANTAHGVGNATQYGHLKLSDATDSLSGATGGIAATPAAVKAAKDAADAAQSSANNAQSSADAAMTKASKAATASAAGIAYFPAPFTVSSDGKVGIRAATDGQTGIVQLSSATNSTSETLAATASAVKAAYDKGAAASAAASEAQSAAEAAVEIDSAYYDNNSNQGYIKFKNGLLICYQTWTTNKNLTGGRRTTFLAPFKKKPCFTAHANSLPGRSPRLSDISATGFTVEDWAEGSVSKDGSWEAIGTYK